MTVLQWLEGGVRMHIDTNVPDRIQLFMICLDRGDLPGIQAAKKPPASRSQIWYWNPSPYVPTHLTLGCQKSLHQMGPGKLCHK